jgi:L-iditol 2-dehydrogenase
MQAGFLKAINTIEIKEVPDPVIADPYEVLLKVEVVGVCGSDLHYYREGKIGSQVVSFPFRIGHEFSATVAETGKRVKRVKAGDRVAIDPAVFCLKCDQCRKGRFNTCRKLLFMGSPGLSEGCLAEYVVVPERSCYPSEKLTFEELMLVEPLSIGVYALQYALPVKGKTIGVLGCGPIGLSTLLAAKAYGAAKLFVTEKLEYRLETAARAGADWTGNPLTVDVVREVSKVEPLLLDAVFECAGEQEALDNAVRLLKPGGALVIVGIHTKDTITFLTDELRRREITLYNVRRQNACTGKALKLIEEGRVKIAFMATHHFPLAHAQEAYNTASNYKDGVLKACITI